MCRGAHLSFRESGTSSTAPSRFIGSMSMSLRPTREERRLTSNRRLGGSVARDPRFTTVYEVDRTLAPRRGRMLTSPTPSDSYLEEVKMMPASAYETWCEPGYQPKRPDKGISLTVNDYPFHNIQYGGPSWAGVVNTPFKTYN